ncbi:uncharacterized protein LOC117173680 isoform X2 [Belonocnema kinseyi]|nr:uncharacterized protein LOC117173680 isoform X2 [Belonocnema kinseyi]
MSQLRSLEKLDFINAGGFINDEFLEIVAKNCVQLTHLNIAGKNSVTDKGICNISKLKKLLFLDMRDIPNIISPPLEKMQNLEVLCCWNCRKIKEATLFLFLQEAPNLRAIDVRECPSVTTELLHVAENVVENRESKKILEIYIERAKIPDNFFYEKPDLLTIGIGSFEGVKYGFENILKCEKIPQIRIQPNAI